MAKAHVKPTTSSAPTAALQWVAWVPLTMTALAGIKGATGSWDLACAALEQQLQAGSLRAIARRMLGDSERESKSMRDLPESVWVAPPFRRTDTMVERRLPPTFWSARPNGDSVRLRHRSYHYWQPGRGEVRSEALVVTFESPSRSYELRRLGWQFFLHRESLARMWPGVIAPVTAPAVTTEPADAAATLKPVSTQKVSEADLQGCIEGLVAEFGAAPPSRDERWKIVRARLPGVRYKAWRDADKRYAPQWHHKTRGRPRK